MSKKNPVAVVIEVPPERRRCGRLGRGKPGRKFRRWARTVRDLDLVAGTSCSGLKLWARLVPEGAEWLQRKRSS